MRCLVSVVPHIAAIAGKTISNFCYTYEIYYFILGHARLYCVETFFRQYLLPLHNPVLVVDVHKVGMPAGWSSRKVQHSQPVDMQCSFGRSKSSY